MEVHVVNVPEQATKGALHNYFGPILKKLSITSFRCQKTVGKNFANITFLHSEDASRFLAIHGHEGFISKKRGTTRPPSSLNLFNQPIYCKMSNFPVDPYLLLVLESEDQHRRAQTETYKDKPREKAILPVSFDISGIACGNWIYSGPDLEYLAQAAWNVPGTTTFRTRSLVTVLDSGYRMDIRYHSVRSIAFQASPSPAFTLTLTEAPRMFKKNEKPLAELIAAIRLNTLQRYRNEFKWKRIASFGLQHDRVAANCFVYRISLTDRKVISNGQRSELPQQIERLRQAREVPPMTEWRAIMSLPGPESLESHVNGYQSLQGFLSVGRVSFKLAFQIQKLVENCYLSPYQVIAIFPGIVSIYQRFSEDVSVNAVRKLFSQIPFPGPGVDADEVSTKTLLDLLTKNAELSRKENSYKNPYSLDNTVLVHRARVTPAGIYLSGPEPESNNRVLRKHSDYQEYFLRVQFCDEDGEPIRFNYQISNEEILHTKFKDVLQSGIKIAGRNFMFLGFSHSSLRSQSCWFMADFQLPDGEVLNAQKVIAELGNFSSIRSPAKCAARIGQAFSDTPHAVTVSDTALLYVKDVERNERVFSDGVGTISMSLVTKIWETLKLPHLVKPTLFQIRYRGAKGMLSLDSRLKGDVLRLRPSMVKYDGSKSNDLEICGSSRKPLPMKLNRQFIKILEDLGVDETFFLNLQAKEVARLRAITASVDNASIFLDRQSIGNAIQLPWLIKELTFLKFDFREDPFLRDVLEMAILIELRKLKHKAQIPVDKGFHLYGIMDETGILEEGEIFCTVIEDGVKRVITGKNMIVTRAPALHPGDIQLANAVTVPKNSPLRQLTNCICFSQKGNRDLPSQLSGGDLDGDLYYVMWDPKARLKRIHRAADYPRQTPIDIGMAVETHHMTDFFIKFMETDQLGRIATSHVVLADQHKEGTLHTDCIKLAGMHSTAVDFSKTGIPVEMKDMPRASRWHPDFMAPGPHVRIQPTHGLSFDEEPFNFADDEQPVADDDEEAVEYRYYRSPKVLGKLYRAIDEREIFHKIHNDRLHGRQSGLSFMDVVWKYVQRRCQLIQYQHKIPWARDIRDMYEESLLNLMTEFSEHPLRPIREIEAVVGNILGKNAIANRRQQELSTSMKGEYDRNAAFIVDCITRDENGDYSSEALERTMACLFISLEEKIPTRDREELVSFKYLAATLCLREINLLPV
ncbi:hypothetical protein BP6252_02831 [Coleophoma cylindrospora]|uniref:RNA-dependent RNA polymerase n=1 Tax=Coleophoma cylindrospora TaxID=1849047 RepID=A0A3D8SGD1_9HELO|nr:hypothetical protein BP6252_02831 [Coleophoma cylindrospora]